MPPNKQVNALPTKSFFVEMFTKDIPLDQAILDLVDNSVDAARRTPKGGKLPLDGFRVTLTFDEEKFLLFDNCGGFTAADAADYAFRFGRPPGAKREANSIGRFGVGMKRALFKFGDEFRVSSATDSETWSIHVDVKEWEDERKSWDFPWSDFEPESDISTKNPGAEVLVTRLHRSVSAVFGQKSFKTQIIRLIRAKHREFISEGLEIIVNGERVPELELQIYFDDDVKPEVWRSDFETNNGHKVSVKVIAGVSRSIPKSAGWYIICNGRLIREADKRTETGWGVVEDVASSSSIPGFHNQFARFRGIVTFESSDSTYIPWNTTKTDIDPDNPIWLAVRQQMIAMMRPIIDFLNELDADIETYTRERSPLYRLVESQNLKSVDGIRRTRELELPERTELSEVIIYVKIQYPKEKDKVDALKHALGLDSARAVGEKTFDLIYARQFPQ